MAHWRSVKRTSRSEAMRGRATVGAVTLKMSSICAMENTRRRVQARQRGTGGGSGASSSMAGNRGVAAWVHGERGGI